MSTSTIAYKVGELYAFTDRHAETRIWGVFEGINSEGRIRLEAATADFKSFRLHITLPPSYDIAKTASRSELRDFAYNLGYCHL